MLKKTLLITVIITLTSPLFSSREDLLYSTLDPKNIKQHLALYTLYPHTRAGKKALQDAMKLMTHSNPICLKLPQNLQPLIALLEPGATENLPHLSEELLTAIKSLANQLENRKLKGYKVKTMEEVLSLPSNEIDLAHALLIDDPKQATYEAMLDLMAIQARARLTPQSTAEEKIEVLNHLIFYEMRFRFPPHSLYVENIDRYTFLSSVLDSRQGVCLGVSILYLALAQRLNLPLEMVTPPGHIYVRYLTENGPINIETTCRGIHIDDDHYLGVNTCKLEERTIKEVIGLSHINEASIYLQSKDYNKANACYQKARSFLQNDPTLDLLQGFCAYLLGKKEEGNTHLKNYLNTPDPYSVSSDTLAEDLYHGFGDASCLEAVLMPVNETRASIQEKKQAIEKALDFHSKFRAGWFALGICWLQLHREKEAIQAFLKFHELTKKDVTCEYYLSHLFATRLDYNNAWKHFLTADALTKAKGHHPKALKNLKKILTHVSPRLNDTSSD